MILTSSSCDAASKLLLFRVLLRRHDTVPQRRVFSVLKCHDGFEAFQVFSYSSARIQQPSYSRAPASLATRH